VEAARGGGGPQFIEALTYRFAGHSRADPGVYRKPGELEAWRERDPLLVARASLAERFDVDEEALSEVAASVDAEIEGLVERSLAAPFPMAQDRGREFKE
jgi:TPP-dependent pyruvate/acetoin dehydrogenase alpha subunit